jgi:hypothetical protein
VRRLLSRLQLGIVVAFALLLAVLIIGGALIGGAFDSGDERTAVAPGPGTPSGGSGGFGAGHHQGTSQTGLNRELLTCLRARGVEIASPNDVYSAPPQALQACGHHAGGATP